MTRVKAVAATGMLGSGFRTDSLETALRDADFVACDAGSSDLGPFYLGSGQSHASDAAVERDVREILSRARPLGIPAIFGSAGTAGATVQLEKLSDTVRRTAKSHGLRFRLALIDTQIPPERVVKAMRAGEVHPLANAPDIDEEKVLACERIVAMAGPEPFIEALDAGADVIVAGRSSDASLFVALPQSRGIPLGVAYHAGKVLECGAAAAEVRPYPDAMSAVMDLEGFTVEPPNRAMRCTPQSVAAHTFYENANPHILVEPGGYLDTSQACYEPINDRAVRVTGSKFVGADAHSVRLEGATLSGYRALVIAGIRDPLVLKDIHGFMHDLELEITTKVLTSLGLHKDQYRIANRQYGLDGTLGRLERLASNRAPVEVGILWDVLAETQTLASAIAGILWHTALHHPVPGYRGLTSNLAFPISPPVVEGGPVYEFALNHKWSTTERYYNIHLEDV